eukprot:SAG31_NODE_12467_length_939_cov_2.242857_2_plen_152_part_01
MVRLEEIHFMDRERVDLIRTNQIYHEMCGYAYIVSKGARFMWATEAEAYFSVSNSSNYDWLPQSPFNVWDLVVKDQDGSDIEVPWQCEQSGGITLDCNWKSPQGGPGISMAFAQAATDELSYGEEDQRVKDRGKHLGELSPGSMASKDALWI